MDWVEQITRHRRALIVAGITLVHGAALAAVLTLNITPKQITLEPEIIIELADILPDLTKPEPEPILQPEPPSPQIQPDPTPIPQTPAQPSKLPAPPLAVLTQNTDDTAPSFETPIVPAEPEPPQTGTATPSQLANVLARAKCRREIATRDPACDNPNPFDALAEKFELQHAAALVPPELNGAFTPSAFERYMASEGHYTSPQGRDGSASSQLHLWPDQDLFEDGMAPAAHQGNRIRNGKGLLDPALERELRAGRE